MIPSKPPMGINVASDTKAGLRYADLIVDGHKTLESRNSDTLRPYVGKRVAIVRTGEGKAKAIGEVTIGEPKVVNQKQFRAMEDEHKVPKGSRFDINTPTKHLYPMHDPVRYEEERDVGHGIVSRKVIHKARGGTVQPTLDEMRLALAKGGKVEVRPTVKDEALMRKIPQMEEAAKKVSEGKMTHAAYDKVIAKHKPIKPYEFVPKPASDEDANRALMENKKPHWRGHEQWPAGRKVGLRLDIPAYENHGVWVNSIHDEEGKGEDKRNTSYGSVSSVKNATFDAGPTKAIKVATGEQNKSPFARIKGDLHHMSEDEAVAHMQKNLNHPDYAQVGMDPRRHGYFYDRKTLQPVTHAKHVVQIGPLVLAHKPTYGERDTYAKGGVIHKADGGRVEPTQDEMRLALLKSRRNGMYSPLEKLAIDIPRNKGTGAEFMAEISKQKGFKPEEVADRKIPIPEGKMTKLEFLKHLRQHSLPPLQEFEMPDMGTGTEARNDRANDYYGDDYEKISPEQQMDVADWVRKHNAKYTQYQIPGGENYREMLLKLPALDIKDERSINYLQAEKRRTDPTEWANSKEGKRLEALMEKAKQFETPYKSGHWRMHPNVLAHVRLSDREGPNGEKLLHLEELQSDWHQQGRKGGYQKSEDEMELERQRVMNEHEARIKSESMRLSEEYKAIKQKMRSMTDFNSPESALLQGQEIETLRKLTALSEAEPPPMPKNRGVPQAPFKKSWHELGMKHVLHHAAKNGYDGVVITPGDEQAERWGDEGLKVHYDKKIPEFLNKFGKPFGVQVGQMPLTGNFDKQQGAQDDELLSQLGVKTPDVPPIKLHHFPINDQMRTSILKEGMPQYMRGGVVHKAEGGAVLPIEQIKAQMMNRFKGLSSLQSIGAEEAPSLGVKAYVPTSGSPDNGQMPVGGVDTSQGALPVGGIDMSKMQQGQQLMPNAPPAPAGMQQGMDQVPMGDKPPMGDIPPQGGSNILSMTPQGQAMAAMKPQGLAKGGVVKLARGGMPFAIKAPQELPKAPSEFTPYDGTNPNIPSLSKAFDEAIAHHLSLSNEDRMINSQRAAMAVAQHTGMTSSGKPKDLLGQNEKLLKSGKGIEGQEPVKLPDGRGVETTGLALAPAYEEGNFNTCPNHHSCKAECLGKTSGNYFKLGGGQDLSEFKGPRLNSLLKTNAFLRDPHALAVKLYDEIDSAKQMAAANGNHLGVRLNVLSDINPRVHKAIIEAHPDVTFYDYTKNNTNPIAPNHHYTYSSTGVSQPGVNNPHTNWKQMRRRLDQGDNVAMAFSHKDHLPEEIHDQETGKKYKVIDGDTHDFRPLDLVGEGEDGVIVGLKNKKATGKMDEAHIDSKGFFLHYDPQLKMSTNAKGQPVYARTASNRISEKTGKPMLGETIPQNRTVNIQPQTRGMIPLTNDGEKQ